MNFYGLSFFISCHFKINPVVFVGFFPPQLSHKCFEHCLVSLEITDLHEGIILGALGNICPKCPYNCSSHGFATLSLKASEREKKEVGGEDERKRSRDWGRDWEKSRGERPRTVSLAKSTSFHFRCSACK